VLSALVAVHADAAITLYEDDGYRGRAVTVNGPISNLRALGFNDTASSVIVEGGRWVACEHEGYRGRCVVFGVGSHSSLRAIGMNDMVTSVRPYRRGLDDGWEFVNAQPHGDFYPWFQRPGERLYDAPVIYVRAVMGSPEQRCWTEYRPGATPYAREPNIGGAIVGAIIGGVIGHQIGSGRGNDVATAAGAVAGAAIGSGGSLPYSREVRRCEPAYGGQVLYYDVTYTFRGIDHHIQMNHPPGPTIRVNARGEPRQ